MGAAPFNLDRLRWVSQGVSAEFILVNVAGYQLYYVRNGALQWETPVMIGTIDSAGCIRVKAPLELARLLLDNPVDWSAEDIQALVDSGAPRQVVQIDRPVDVLLLYLTASPTPDGRIQYHHDVYQRDPAALAALQNPPRASVRAQRDSL